MKKLLTLLFFGVLVWAINLRLPSVAAQSGNDPIPPQADWTAVDPFPTLTGTSRFVGAGGDLQAALNASRPGDEVVLQAGATFTGSFVLPVQSGTGWIVIRSSNLSSLTAGHRVDPAVDAGNMPKIVTNQTNVPALLTAWPDCSTPPCKVAQYYRLAGLEITYTADITSTGDLVDVGDPSIADPAQLAQYIYFDRCYIHGVDGRTNKRGVGANGRWVAVTDSYLSNFKAIGADSQAFSAWNGPGPFKLDNSFFEGAGENVIFGGGDPAIPHMIASDITITRNTMKKRLSWYNNDPSYAGILWIIKNIFELKNAQRVLVDGNDFEYSWEGEQIYAITLTPRNQTGGDQDSTVQDVTFTNNFVRHAAGGVSLLAEDDLFPTQVEKRIRIANNVFDDISQRWKDQGHATDGVGYAFLINAAMRGVAGPSYVTVDHNVFVTDGSSYIVIGAYTSNPRDVPNFTFTNNIVYHSLWGVKGDNAAPDGSGGSSSTFLLYFDNTLVFTNNAIVGTTDGTPSGPDWSGGYTSPPATLVGNVSGNVFPKTWNDVGFVNFAAGDYHLSTSSPYRTAGTGGSAIGADVDQIVAHQTGDGSSSLPPPWLQADVGQTGVAGSATYASSTGTFTVKGAGIDVWGTQDGFHYVYQPLNGDGQIVARVTHVDPTATFAKAAVMIRETLADNSAHVILDVKPDGENEFMTRPSTGATTQWLAGANQTTPAWLKLVRAGSIVTGYVSANGQSWTQVGQTTLNIASSAYVGLVVCAISTTQLNTSTFDNVAVTATGPGNIVIYASDIGASQRHGVWTTAADSTSPNGIKLVTPDNGWASLDVALASPADYVDVTFNANAGTSYRLWLRLQATPATPTSKFNDSVWVQFSDALSGGSPIYPLNSTSGLNVNLATDSGATSLNGWGWANTAYWLSQTTAFTFAAGGTHTLRIQLREDGVQLDQIVLSPTTYYNAAPGGPTNDSTIVPK